MADAVSKERLLTLGGMLPLDWGRFCVYALWYQEKVVYVGYTGNLRARMQAHKCSRRYSNGLIDGFTFTPFVDRTDAINFERAMILELQPEGNKQKLNIDFGGQHIGQEFAGGDL